MHTKNKQEDLSAGDHDVIRCGFRTEIVRAADARVVPRGWRRMEPRRLGLACQGLETLGGVLHDRLTVTDPDHADVEPGQAVE